MSEVGSGLMSVADMELRLGLVSGICKFAAKYQSCSSGGGAGLI